MGKVLYIDNLWKSSPESLCMQLNLTKCSLWLSGIYIRWIEMSHPTPKVNDRDLK